MSNFTATRLGQANLAGDVDALFLQVFAGEVLTAFYAKNKTLDKHTVRTIPHGKSASFPVVGTGTASYHTPGTEIDGTTVAQNEVIIEVDDKLIAARFIADIDEAKNHFDIRGIFSRDMGEQLARQWDKNVLQLGVLAARASAIVSGGNGGSVVTAANAKTDAAVLRQAILDSVEALAAKDVPTDNAYVYVRPSEYFLLVNDDKLTSKEFAEGNGSVAKGAVYFCGGLPLVMTNNLPITDLSAVTPAKYAVNANTTAALVMTPAAVGTVKLMDLSMQAETTVRHQGTLMVARYAIGSDVLRPECAVEIRTGAPA